MIQAHEDVLRHILDVARMSDQPIDRSQDSLSIRLNNLIERSFVAGLRALDRL